MITEDRDGNPVSVGDKLLGTTASSSTAEVIQITDRDVVILMDRPTGKRSAMLPLASFAQSGWRVQKPVEAAHGT